jgi:hypothetical protein
MTWETRRTFLNLQDFLDLDLALPLILAWPYTPDTDYSELSAIKT